MSKLLIVVPPFFGHVSPTLSLGSALLAQGHEVVWAGIEPLADKHLPEGGRFVLLKMPPDMAGGEESQKNAVKELIDPESMKNLLEFIIPMLEKVMVPMAHLMMHDLEELVDNWQPDAIIHDVIVYAGPICAIKKGIPYITTSAVPPSTFKSNPISNGEDAMPKMAQQHHKIVSDLIHHYGLEAPPSIMHSEGLSLYNTTKDLFEGESFPESMKFLGPLFKGRPTAVDFDWDTFAQNTTPKVYVTLGTIAQYSREDFFAKLTAAFADMPVTFYVASDPNVIDEWPDNFVVQSYMPQSELIPKMDAVICHGGFNTLNETLYHGLPMLVIPMAFEQAHTASLVHKKGCGICIKFKRLTVKGLQKNLHKILEEPDCRLAAQQMGESLKACGGEDRAVALIEAYLAKTPEQVSLR